MMSEESNHVSEGEIIDPESVERAFDAVEERVNRIRRECIEAAQYTGYICDVLSVARSMYLTLANQAIENPELLPIVASGVNYLYTLGAEVEQLEQKMHVPTSGLYQVSASAHTFISSSGTVSAVTNVTLDEAFIEPPSFMVSDEEAYAERFGKLDPSLGETYREIWEAYYGTVSDPVRAALSLMRQAFDHFFDVLAPDNEVRSSAYWRPKSGDNPNRVYRRERIEFAVHSHVKNKARANTLIANLDQIMKTYQLLNKLHKRGALKQKEARRALMTMKRFLEDFADAMNL